MLFRRDLIRPPRLHSREANLRDRKVSWLELFYDLVFVVAVSQAAGALNSDLSIYGFFKFSILFITIWWAWVGHTFYLTRFDTDDLAHRLTGLLQILAVAGLAAFIPRALHDQATGFVLSYCFIRGVIIFEYWRAGVHNPEARDLTNRYMRGFSLGVAIWLVSLFFPPHIQILIWALGVFVDVLTPLMSNTIHLKHPPHLSHLPERFGLFTIIVLGEAISSVVMGVSRVGIDFTTAISSMLGLLIAFSIWWIYFDSVRGADSRPVDSSQQVKSYQLWLYSHLPLKMGIVVCAIGVKQTILTPWGDFLNVNQSLAIAGGLGAALLSLGAICHANPNRDLNLKNIWTSVPALLVALTAWGLGSLHVYIPAIVLLLLLALTAMVQVVLTLRVH